jgi:hypothetical protein
VQRASRFAFVLIHVSAVVGHNEGADATHIPPTGEGLVILSILCERALQMRAYNNGFAATTSTVAENLCLRFCSASPSAKHKHSQIANIRILTRRRQLKEKRLRILSSYLNDFNGTMFCRALQRSATAFDVSTEFFNVFICSLIAKVAAFSLLGNAEVIF